MRVLVIEDYAPLRTAVVTSLREAGYAVDAAADGASGLDAALEGDHDVIVLDLMLPDVSGTEICRRIRADGDLGELPVLMLTAKSEEIDKVIGLETGADDYVTKPFSTRDIVERARRLLEAGEE